MMLATARLPQIKTGGKSADAVAGLLGGVMAPLSGFSGLAPALWASLRGYNKDEHRAVLQNFNLIVLSATVASNVFYGRLNRGHLPQMAVVAGALILPAIEDLHRHERGGVSQDGAVAAGRRRRDDADRRPAVDALAAPGADDPRFTPRAPACGHARPPVPCAVNNSRSTTLRMTSGISTGRRASRST
jgi:hypothetical protein